MDSSRDLPTCPQPLRLPQQDISIELKQRTFLTSFDRSLPGGSLREGVGFLDYGSMIQSVRLHGIIV